MPHWWGATVAITALVAIAASTALPPACSVAMPALVASCSAAETAPLTPRTEVVGGAVTEARSTHTSERAPASKWPAAAQAAGVVAGERREQSCRARYAAAYHRAVSTHQQAGEITVTVGAAE